MTKINYQSILDLAASVDWGYIVKFQQHDLDTSDIDWWMYITRPGKENYSVGRVDEEGHARNDKWAARAMAIMLGDDLLLDLGISSKLDLIHRLAQKETQC